MEYLIKLIISFGKSVDEKSIHPSSNGLNKKDEFHNIRF